MKIIPKTPALRIYLDGPEVDKLLMCIKECTDHYYVTHTDLTYHDGYEGLVNFYKDLQTSIIKNDSSNER